MSAETMTFWALMALAGVWAAWMLVSGLSELWRTRRTRWWEHVEGDYLDLRPRTEIGRRKWR